MDLLAPNPQIMSTGFVQLGIVLVVIIVAGFKRSASLRPIMIWAKLNSPLVSIVLGVLWALASYALFRPAPNMDDYFVVGMWIAGGSGLVGSIFKDVADGSVKTASVAGVTEMRTRTRRSAGRNIG